MLEAELMICQLPRVDQRLSAMLWMLAELADRGVVVRHPDGWLLVEPPPDGDASPAALIQDAEIAQLGIVWVA
jgi:hypothetical protein